MSRKEKFEKINLPPKRDPYIEIKGYGRYGYVVTVTDPGKHLYCEYDAYTRHFWWGKERAEAWGKRKLAKYIKRREHEDYERVIY